MLDMIWKKLNDPELYDVEELEKYSKLFIMWQKHYFTYKSLAPKKLKNNDIISELINNKES
jgi:hypothetical protein